MMRACLLLICKYKLYSKVLKVVKLSGSFPNKLSRVIDVCHDTEDGEAKASQKKNKAVEDKVKEKTFIG